VLKVPFNTYQPTTVTGWMPFLSANQKYHNTEGRERCMYYQPLWTLEVWI